MRTLGSQSLRRIGKCTKKIVFYWVYHELWAASDRMHVHKLQEPQELHEDTWQSITGQKIRHYKRWDFILHSHDSILSQWKMFKIFRQSQIMYNFPGLLVVLAGLTQTKPFVAQPRFVTQLPVSQSYHLSPTIAKCQQQKILTENNQL